MVMFFGLTNTPATFQLMMNHLFRELIDEGYVTIYMDDILIHTPNDPALHRRVVNDVLRILAVNVTTFPPFTLSHAYLELSLPKPHFVLHVSSATSPSFHYHASLLRHLPTWLPLHYYLGL